MSPTGLEGAAIAEIVKLLLSITDKILDRMPTYAQSKREQYFYLRKRYENEIAKEYPNRDDNLCGVYRRDLLLYLAVFDTEISRAKLSSVPGQADGGSKTP